MEKPNINIKKTLTSEKNYQEHQKASEDESEGQAWVKMKENPTEGQHHGILARGLPFPMCMLPHPVGSLFPQE